jgi:hypothetical protein
VEKNNEYAVISNANSIGYELELSGLRCVGGHDPVSVLFKDEVDIFHYIYFPQRIGNFDSVEITLTYEKGKYEYPNAIQNVKGTLDVKDQEVIIDLEIPKYDNSGKIENYQSYEFNGRYTIRINKDE